MRGCIALALILGATCAQAQTWEELRAVPKETSVRIFEAGKKSTFADGKLLLVKDDELTILRPGRRGQAFVIPKAQISRVETRRRDPPWEGMVIGALGNILLGWAAGGWQACTNTPECVAGGIAFGAGIGALIDWQKPTKRTVYRAP